VGKEDGRMLPLTEEIPKCLLPLANTPILLHQLAALEQAGLGGVCVAHYNDHEGLKIRRRGVRSVPTRVCCGRG
jgi:NDP-sugar pyrophosphorylase family protein